MTGLELIHLRIRCPSSPTRAEQELEVEVRIDASVRELKDILRPKLQVAPAQQLRLISSGKLLAPDTSTLDSFGLNDSSFVHVVISAAPNRPPPAPAHNTGTNTNNNSQQGSSAITGPLRGFDSLLQGQRGSSLSADEISAIRAYFSEAVAEFARERLRRGEEESETDFRLRAESAWVAEQGPTSEFHMNLNSMLFFPRQGGSETNFDLEDTGGRGLLAMEGVSETGNGKDFVYGLILGYFLGFMMIFCVWDRHIPYRQKLGLLCGIMLQMGTAMWRHRMEEQHQPQNTSGVISNSASASSSTASLVGDLNIHAHLRGGAQ